VRYSGGPQCGHRVVTPSGVEHVFSQFGAGMLVDVVETFLAQPVLVNPLNLLLENRGLKELGIDDGLDRLTIDPFATIITPFHVAANRVKELSRGLNRHGSCGQGVGEARGDALRGMPTLRAGDLSRRPHDVLTRLQAIQRAKYVEIETLLDRDDAFEASRPLRDLKLPAELIERYEPIEQCVRFFRPRVDGPIVFEGAQGILLDEQYGLEPHRTWTDTTSRKAHKILDDWSYQGDRRTIGVTRAYLTRHGRGPFPTESPTMTEAYPDIENGRSEWQGAFRVGHLDLVLLRYALDCDRRIDELAVTCLDRLRGSWRAGDDSADVFPRSIWSGRRDAVRGGETADELVELIETELRLPVTIRSNGETADDKFESARITP
jgi:adenylosuccinate synthase